MKTRLLSPMIAFGILACFFFMPTRAKAQAPYQVTNNTHCVLTITYTFYSWNGSTCVFCTSGSTNVPPSPPVTNIPRPAGCDCGVQIDITAVNGVPITPITGTSGVPPFMPHGSGAGGNCSPTISIDVHPSAADIHP